jgi:hypothetical protein
VTVPLPVPDDPRIATLIAEWPDGSRWPFRSRWLHDLEEVLRSSYPFASSDQLTLTARNLAPFPLALPGVP